MIGRQREPHVLPAAKVAAWRLARHGLLGARLIETDHVRTPEAVARTLVGVQAQVLSSAALSIAIRSGDVVEAIATALAERRLVRSWAMRGTLHLFAADDYPRVRAIRAPALVLGDDVAVVVDRRFRPDAADDAQELLASHRRILALRIEPVSFAGCPARR